MTLRQFQSWFVGVLEALYKQPEAGFPILMIAFPLLERYLRQKAGLGPDDKLNANNDAFYKELIALFSELKTIDKATEFWHIYRNGLLHQVALNQTRKGGAPVSGAALSGDLSDIYIDATGYLIVNAADFSKRVTREIEQNFATFEGAASNAPALASVWSMPHPVPQAKPTIGGTAPQATGSGIPQPMIYGTSAKPPKT